MNRDKNLILPNFICIGAQKTGTTTLYHILKNHPQITVCKPRKETKFFLRDDEYQNGLEFYSQYFSYEKPKKAIGEFDPDYIYFDYIPERIYKDLGKEIKMIVMFRHPVDRAYSQYLMSIRKGWEEESFEKAIKLEDERLRNATQIEKSNFSYISRGKYAEQLERYFRLFPKENFLFINYDEEFKTDLPGVLKKIFIFLGVDYVELDTNMKMNEASVAKSKLLVDFLLKDNPIKSFLSMVIRNSETKRKWKNRIKNWNRKKTEVIPLSPEFKNKLYCEYFSEDIEQLEKMTGMNLSSWKIKIQEIVN